MGRYEELTDEQLIERMRTDGLGDSSACREELFRRVYPRIARWCLRLCNERNTATDLAQDVVERVHGQLESFRLESRFSTWLYTVTRRTAINRLRAEQRHTRNRADHDRVPEAVDPGPQLPEMLTREAVGSRIHKVIADKLDPMEAQVVYLHYVDGMTLPAITELLDLTNKSGSKALLVAGMRKLRRHLGPWLERQFAV